MDDICAVCNKKIGVLEGEPQPGIYTHPSCEATFLQNPEKYGGKATKAQKKTERHRVEQQQKIEDKSVYVKDGSVHVKSFDMPFGDMVGFMVKWALASIPAFIILFIIFGIFFAIFGSLFF